MNCKQFMSNLAKVKALQEKQDIIQKEIDTILLAMTATFKRDQGITYLDKNNNQITGKVIYFRGQKSLTVITLSNEKVNVPLNQLIFDK